MVKTRLHLSIATPLASSPGLCCDPARARRSQALVVSYALVSNAQGKLPDQVPVISEAAALQIGPS
eukprot:scaffold1690_cov118-Isochrysis_galbana.AAC.5